MAAAGSGYLAKGSSYSLTLNLSTVGLNEATIAKYIREQEAHERDDLLNGSTRLNVSLSTGEFSPNACQPDAPDEMLAGVNAHNSFVTGERKNSYEDRLAMQLTYLTRKGRVTCTNKHFTGFRQLSSRRNRVDFAVTNPTRDISFDFDCKRKPVR